MRRAPILLLAAILGIGTAFASGCGTSREEPGRPALPDASKGPDDLDEKTPTP